MSEVINHARALSTTRGEGLPASADLLNGLRHTLQDILPSVADQRAAALLQMSDLILRHVIARETLGAPSALDVARSSGTGNLVDPGSIEIEIAAAIAAMRDTQARANAQSILQLIAEERKGLALIDAAEQGVEHLGLEACHRDRFELTSDRLEEYLRGRVPGLGCISVRTVRQIVGGLSKETFLIDADDDGTAIDLVLRRDIPNPPIQSSAADEFAVLRPLFERGLMVPEPLWAETDPAVFGMPFLLSKKIKGRAISGAVEIADLPGEARSNCELLATFLAQLHGMDTSLAPSLHRPNYSGRDYVCEHVALWRDWWRLNQMEPSAILATAFDLLLERAPDVERPVLVHGDAGLHNIMIENGETTGMIDWELVHIGDPAEDLLYARNWTDQVMPFEDFVAIYRASGGRDFDSSRQRYFSLLNNVRNVTCTIAQYRGYRDALDPLLPSAYSGLKWQKEFLGKAARDLEHLIKSGHAS